MTFQDALNNANKRIPEDGIQALEEELGDLSKYMEFFPTRGIYYEIGDIITLKVKRIKKADTRHFSKRSNILVPDSVSIETDEYKMANKSLVEIIDFIESKKASKTEKEKKENDECVNGFISELEDKNIVVNDFFYLHSKFNSLSKVVQNEIKKRSI